MKVWVFNHKKTKESNDLSEEESNNLLEEGSNDLLEKSNGLLEESNNFLDEEQNNLLDEEQNDFLNEESNDLLEKDINDLSEEDSIYLKWKKKYRHFLVGSLVIVCIGIVSFTVGTRSGREIFYNLAGLFLHEAMDTSPEVLQPLVTPYPDDDVDSEDVVDLFSETDITEVSDKNIIPRSEEGVDNFLLLGIEEINNARNTDSIMIVSINKKSKEITLVSILRDTYIEYENRARKLNAYYAAGGMSTLISVIEENYRIKIDGYAYVNFEAFEKVVDELGGVDIELGAKEAAYLNVKNYISNPTYRNVKAGMNHLNGNQALGYARVRKVETLGGVNDDYGRTLRQRRLLTAIFDKYKKKNIFDLLSITTKCLSYVKTNVTSGQISDTIEFIVEDGITSLSSERFPYDGLFEDPHEYNGITYPILPNWEENIVRLYQDIYKDTEEEARAAYLATEN
ncbi:LCP family protein [Lachnoclostridium phytofermentans]|uniref:Cell envelope-related transcriptional attenuator n=1 Tax=Lachnoclostridium phytofermentans (strain ATCC 700394 / DSM 18823 / ISDg) TaxID=357809 RepID=A9KL90_LACP7|nr:LCP family protein [Lachnoclostridium phytofermentans]ABX44239.1 cell envelope-related transcriptional attenuator [Lachnoclostridium phytofermentans ISDg]